MSDIKAGDLVMVIKGNPCCGNSKLLGRVFVVSNKPPHPIGVCGVCGDRTRNGSDVVSLSDDSSYCAEKWRLKKIDPPAEGDSLPTRADLEVTA